MRTFLLLIRQGDETVEGLMAPWGKAVPIEGHWGEPVTDEEKQDLIDDYKRFWREDYENNSCDDYPDWLKKGIEPSFDEAYEDDGEAYNENAWRKDENGVWRHWIAWEYNPDWHWDMYAIGGNKDGKKFQTGPDNFKEMALKGEIINLQDLDFAELLMNGEWIEVKGKVYDHIKDLPDDAELVCICYHF